MSFNRNIYEGLLRFLAIISAVVMMFISAQFSVDGFAFQSPDKLYIGWLLAVILIVVEMNFNNNPPVLEQDDPAEARRMLILFIGGLVAYGYGIATNISGILHSGPLPDTPFDYIVPVALGLFLEVVPEPLLVRALLARTNFKPQQQNQKHNGGGKPHYNNYPQQKPHYEVQPDLRKKIMRAYASEEKTKI